MSLDIILLVWGIGLIMPNITDCGGGGYKYKEHRMVKQTFRHV